MSLRAYFRVQKQLARSCSRFVARLVFEQLFWCVDFSVEDLSIGSARARVIAILLARYVRLYVRICIVLAVLAMSVYVRKTREGVLRARARVHVLMCM